MRPIALAAVASWLTPVFAVGASALGLSFTAAVAMGAATAIPIAVLCAGPLAATVRPVAHDRVVVVLLGVLALAAIGQIARTSVFMADVTRTEFSQSQHLSRIAHCCLTGYAAAAGFALEGTGNIFEESQYAPRQVASLRADTYHYPPTFLLLPMAFRLVSTEFLDIRALWFVMQSVVLAAVVLGIPWWIGGREGAFATVGGLAFLALPQALLALQVGNFQITAIPVAVASFLLLWSGRVRVGALPMAFVAIGKIFPGLLVLYLLAAHRSRALIWTSAAGLVLVVASVAALGSRPFVDFVRYELPRISNGAAFPQSEQPQTVSHNHSVYGLTTRLRQLGLASLDAPTGRAIASGYGLALVAVTVLVARRRQWDLARSRDRLMLAQVALAMVTLASFTSPFVGAVYGLASTFWLLSMVAAGVHGRWRAATVALGTGVLAFASWRVPVPPQMTPRWGIWLSLVVLVVAIGANAWVVARAGTGGPTARD